MQTLVDWEKRLKPFFDSGLRIIGEIPLSETELDEIADLFRQQVQQGKFRASTRRITQNYPLSFMTLLAHFSARNDQQGFWNTLAERFGVEVSAFFNSGWNTKFLELCESHRLMVFSPEQMRTAYVATIRYHGGIPSYSLPDLFERMVIPAVNHPELRKIPAKDALDYLVKHVNFVDRPVLDFLENSGEMGLAWFEACCKLVRHAKENHGEVLPISEVPELPYNIHSFFEQYYEEKEERGFHWSRPYLQVNLQSEDSPVVLRIPEQIITTQAASQGLQWRISWPGQEETTVIPCQLARRGSDRVVLDEFFPVATPTQQLTISISTEAAESVEESELRRWTLSLLPPPGQAPLIAFRENDHLVPAARSLPAQPLYLLTPILSEMEVDPATTEMLDSLPPFSSGWKDWKLEQWDLSNAISLLLFQDGNPLGNTVPVAREVDQPELVGGHKFDYQGYADQPLYTTDIPSVSIPVPSIATAYQALTGWKLRLTSVGEAAPKIDKQVTFLEHREDCQFEGSRAVLPLERILGSRPAGIYDLKVNGPHGVKADFRLGLWPKLLLQNYSMDLPRAEESREPVQFNIYLQDGAWVEPQPGAYPVEIARDAKTCSVKAPPDLRRVELDLVTNTQNGGQIRVPISIPVVRLRWGLIEDNSPRELDFGQNVLHISKVRFDQYASRALHVEMHGLGNMIKRMSCQLVETGNESNLLQLADFGRTGFSADWLKVSLLGFSDTIRSINTQVQFQLVYQKDSYSPVIRYALLEVSPELEVSDANLEQVAECDWKLTWKEDLPLKNRRVMLKSAWQPWSPAIEQKIPDENKGEILLTDISLPPSSYEIYFYIKYKWELEQMSPPGNATCMRVNLIDPAERLAALDKLPEGQDAQFRYKIEAACILDELGETEQRDEAVTSAATHLIHLQDVGTLVGAIRWINNKDIRPFVKSFFRKRMFNQQLAEAMLRKYPQRDTSLAEYLRLVTRDVYSDTARLLLEKVDDPFVVRTCMGILLEREDSELPHLVSRMIDQGRISAESAADLLALHPDKRMWALEEVSNLARSNSTDSLLAAIFPSCVAEITQTSPAWLHETLLLVATIERSRENMLRYLEILIGLRREEVWPVLFEKQARDLISHQDFCELLRLDPEKALIALRTGDGPDRFPAEIQALETEFPNSAGLFQTGMELQTPFGQARIVNIRLLDGAVVQQARRSDANFLLKVEGGTGMDRVEVEMNFSNLTLKFINAATIYGCTRCTQFFHPRQQKLNEHYHLSHPFDSQTFQLIKGIIPFNRSDIQYAHQSD